MDPTDRRQNQIKMLEAAIDVVENQGKYDDPIIGKIHADSDLMRNSQLIRHADKYIYEVTDKEKLENAFTKKIKLGLPKTEMLLSRAVHLSLRVESGENIIFDSYGTILKNMPGSRLIQAPEKKTMPKVDSVKKESTRKNADPKPNPEDTLRATVERKERAKNKKEKKRLRASHAEEAARAATSENSLKEDKVVSEPETLDCRLCPAKIQPKEEEYFRFCCDSRPKDSDCSFTTHKDCLIRVFGKVKKNWKGESCPSPSCDRIMEIVYLVKKDVEESIYIKAEHKKPVSDEKTKTKKEKRVENKENLESYDSHESTDKEKMVDEEPEQKYETVDVVQEVPTTPVETVQLSISPKLPVEFVNAVPLAKKKDETEEKYSVNDRAVIIKTRSKKQKNKTLPIVFDEFCADLPAVSVQKNPIPGTVNFDKQFPYLIDDKITFVLPGALGSEKFEQDLIAVIWHLIDDIPANLTAYQPTSDPVSEEVIPNGQQSGRTREEIRSRTSLLQCFLQLPSQRIAVPIESRSLQKLNVPSTSDSNESLDAQADECPSVSRTGSRRENSVSTGNSRSILSVSGSGIRPEWTVLLAEDTLSTKPTSLPSNVFSLFFIVSFTQLILGFQIEM